MALDPNILFQLGKGVTPLLSPTDIQNQQLEREAGAYKLNALRQSSQDDATYRDVLRSGASPEMIPNKLFAAGLGQQGQQWQKFQTDQQKTQQETQKAKLEAGIKQFEVIGHIMSGVRDQQSYDQARHQVASIVGPDAVANIPPVYDPATVARNQQQALSVKQQMEQKWKAMEYSTPDANARLQAQTSQANNAATIDTMQRGQNLTDARSRDLAALKSQELVQQKQLATEAKNLDRVDKKVTAFSGQLDKTNIPQFESLLGDIEGEITKYSQAGDIPGYGKSGNLPQFLLTDEGKTLRQKIAQLQNLTLKDRSGAAVTNQELQRLLNELGTGLLSTDAQLKTGLSQVRRNLDAIKQNVVAGVDDDTLNEYRSRGGMPLTRGAPKAGGTLRVTNAEDYAKVPSGATYTTPDGKTRRKP